MFKANNNERQSGVDWPQLAAVLLLMVISIAFVYSATNAGENAGEVVWYRQSCFRH